MTTVTSPQINTNAGIGIGGTVQKYSWNWQAKQYQIVYETIGQGNPVLILPAFSTVSSRTEMKGIAQILSYQYRVTVLDWLGFGESECPPVDYSPVLFHQLLQDFVKSLFDQPIIIIAAGHTAGYVLELAKNQSETVSKIVLIAPTWQGPLRVMGLPLVVRSGVRNLVRSPIVGQTLYYLNTTPSFLRLMYKRHVYVDETKLTKEFISQKHQITSKPGARYAPAAFVTGKLDPVTTREEFLDYFSSLSVPVLVIMAENAPPKSKAEMEVIQGLPQVETARLTGTLGIYEEYPQEVTAAISQFL